ncbi:MAG: hypothetical protein RL088_2063 [Verrucomicrobiota bacterium]|jgi:hypothetical protein
MRASVRLLICAAAVLLVADVAARADESVTPLMSAAAAGDLEKVAALLRDGAEVDRSDARGRTAVWHAVRGRQPAALGLLLEKAKASPARCPLGRDALDAAFASGDWALIRPILDAGRDNLGWTPATRRFVAKAINARKAEQVAALVAKCWREPVMEGSRHPILAHAVVSGDVETTKFLLDCGFDPNTRIGNLADPDLASRIPQSFIRFYVMNDRGVTVLMLAAGMGRTEIAKLLVERGARTGTGTTRHKMAALSFAAKTNNHDMMRVLIGPCPLPSQLRVEISLGSQTATLYKNGEAVESTMVSTGVEGNETKAGRFLITDKTPDHVSNIYKGAKMPWFMRLNCGDFGLHQGVVTGAPASHGCIRLPAEIAKRWYAKLPVGTEVTIVE